MPGEDKAESPPPFQAPAHRFGLPQWLTGAGGGSGAIRVIDIGAFRFAPFNESGMIAVIELSGGSGKISRPLVLKFVNESVGRPA